MRIHFRFWENCDSFRHQQKKQSMGDANVEFIPAFKKHKNKIKYCGICNNEKNVTKTIPRPGIAVAMCASHRLCHRLVKMDVRLDDHSGSRTSLVACSNCNKAAKKAVKWAKEQKYDCVFFDDVKYKCQNAVKICSENPLTRSECGDRHSLVKNQHIKTPSNINK
jgi:hypothetical protein